MITYVIIPITGWLTGVIVNYLSDVLPLRRKLTQAFCIQCNTNQTWINYLLWPRKCPVCSHRRGARVWVVEGFYALASILLYENQPERIGFLLGLALLAYFGVVVLIDMEYRMIMHPVSIIGACLGLYVGYRMVGLQKALIGGAAGFVIMWLLYQLGILLIKVLDRARGRPVNDVALGFGDVILSGILGFMLGWPVIIYGLVIAILIGGLVSLIYIIFKLITRQYHALMAIPYGPFLVSGAVLLIYFRGLVLMILGN